MKAKRRKGWRKILMAMEVCERLTAAAQSGVKNGVERLLDGQPAVPRVLVEARCSVGGERTGPKPTS